MNRGTMVIANGTALLLLICAGCTSPEVRTDARRTAPVKETLTDEQRVQSLRRRPFSGGKRWYDKADLDELTAIADRGNAEAQYLVGMILSHSEWHKPNYWIRTNNEEAHASFLKAANQGHAEAAFETANDFMLGKGVKKDEGEALRWYEAAAERNHARAQCLAGNLYIQRGDKNRTERDVFKGIDWLQKSARSGDPMAQQALDAMGVRADDPAVTVRGGIVDLTIESVTYEPKSISRQAPTQVTVTAITRNLGTGPCGPISYALYLSRDKMLQPTEDSLVYLAYGLGLAGGGQRTDTSSWVIDLKRPLIKPGPGAYHVIMLVDFRQEISETDESNNVYVSPAADFLVE